MPTNWRSSLHYQLLQQLYQKCMNNEWRCSIITSSCTEEEIQIRDITCLLSPRAEIVVQLHRFAAWKLRSHQNESRYGLEQVHMTFSTSKSRSIAQVRIEQYIRSNNIWPKWDDSWHPKIHCTLIHYAVGPLTAAKTLLYFRPDGSGAYHWSSIWTLGTIIIWFSAFPLPHKSCRKSWHNRLW